MFIINRNYHIGGDTNEAYGNPSEYQAYINPVITETKGEKVEIEETCLTIPFIKFIVPRFPEIKLEFRDEFRDFRVETLTGQLSYITQHCINHLDG